MPVKRMRFLVIYSSAALVLLLLLAHLDAVGLFIYFGYILAYLLVIGTIGVALFAFGRNSRTRMQTLTAVFVSVLLLGGVPFIARSSTSPRKQFFLAYKSLTPGMAMRDALAVMKPFGEPDRRLAPDTLTYRYQSDKSTIDVVHLNASKDGKQVVSVEFSPD